MDKPRYVKWSARAKDDHIVPVSPFLPVAEKKYSSHHHEKKKMRGRHLEEKLIDLVYDVRDCLPEQQYLLLMNWAKERRELRERMRMKVLFLDDESSVRWESAKRSLRISLRKSDRQILAVYDALLQRHAN